MALNHILYRPQVLQRPVRSQAERLPDEAMEMASRLLANGVARGRTLDLLKEGLEEALDAIAPEIEARLDQTAASIKALIDPVLKQVETIAEALENIDSPAGGFQSIGQGLMMLADVLENLDADAVEEVLNSFAKVITEDMGLTKDRMIDFVSDLIDKVADKLKSDFINGDHSEESHNSYLVGAYLEKLKLHTEELLLEIDLSVDLAFFAKRIAGFLRNRDWDRIRLRTAKVFEESGETINLLGALMNIFSGEFNAEVEVNATARTGGGGGGGGPIEDPVSWYLTHIERRFGWATAVGVADRTKIDEEPDYRDTVSYGNPKLTAKVMEEIAWATDLSADSLEGLLHLFSLEKKDLSGNISQAGLKALRAILKGALANNNDASWVGFYKVYGNRWLEILIKMLLSLLTGLESSHGCNGEGQSIFWLTLVGADLTEGLLYSNWVSRLRQGLLSLLTLINSDVVNKPYSENHEDIDGFSMLICEAFSWIDALISGRENYGFPSSSKGGDFFWGSWFGISSGFAIVGSLVGWGCSWAIAQGQQEEGTAKNRTRPSAGRYFTLFAEALVSGLFKHPVYNYLVWNGATDDGKVGQDTDENWREDFPGYGSKSSSPYLLPYKKGDVRQCAQNNMGPWSHNPNTFQIYAYDWDHDHDMEVLSVRGGTVSAWHDHFHDHTTLRANTLSVRHDLTDPDPDHDRDHTGVVVTTSKYVHGAHFGIRHVFALRGIPARFITNSTIDQGVLVMLAGDTGRSFYNHLHMHVGTSNAKSVPWVFRDEDAPDDGVIMDLNWYESDNERIPDPATFKVGHPNEHQSTKFRNLTVVSATTNSVVITYSGGWTVGTDLDVGKPDTFPGLVARFNSAATGWQSVEIESHEWDEPVSNQATITLKDNWVTAPVVGNRVELWALARGTTANTITLDRFANNYNDKYSNRHIHVWWTDAAGVTFHEYQWIESYDCDDRKATINVNWNVQPPSFANFEIGGRMYDSANEFYQRFTFLYDLGFSVPIANLAQFAYQYGGLSGTIVGAPTLGTNTVVLNAPAPATAAEVVNRFFVITTNNLAEQSRRIIAYRRATNYNPATRTVTVVGNWDEDYPNGQLRYSIGQVDYAAATNDDLQRNAFICPDSNPNAYTPVDFITGSAGKPYLTLTYNS